MERVSWERTFRSPSVEVTEEAAERLGRALGAGSLVALTGDLGAGKTAFVRGLARGLEVADPVSSPTFALMQQYEGRLVLYHFDAWMRGREAALLADGAEEYLRGAGVAVVEWADRVASFLPRPHVAITLEHLGPETRRIRARLEEAEAEGDGRLLESLVQGLEALSSTPGLDPGGA